MREEIMDWIAERFELSNMTRVCHAEIYDADEYIIKPNEINTNVYIITEGTADGFATSTSKRPSYNNSPNNNHILTPSNTSNQNMPSIPKMLRVHSDISTIGTPNDTLTIDTIELPQCNPSKSNELDEGNAYFTDDNYHQQIPMDNYYKNYTNYKNYNQTNAIIDGATTNNNYLIPPPPPLPSSLPLYNNVPPPPPMTGAVTKSNISPPPNNYSNKLTYDLRLFDMATDILTVSKCNSSEEIDNIDNELSDDTIMKHLNTIDSDFDGEEDVNSMKAVRHPTMSNCTQSYDISPQFNVQITTPNGMSNISFKKDNLIQAMENIKKEIYFIYNNKYNISNNISNNMKDSDSFDNKMIEIPKTNDQSLDSCSIGNTPRPNEYSKDSIKNSKDENSHNIMAQMDDENDRNSYAVQLRNIDEPTYTNSTMIDDRSCIVW